MLILLKIVHFFCLFGGGAAMMGNGILMRRVMASGAPPEPLVAGAMRRLGRIGLISVVLLWLTGIAMVWLGGAAPGWPFYVKLAAAAVVLGGSALAGWTVARAGRDGVAPDMMRLRKLSMTASAGAAVAVIFAVIAFN